MEQKPELKNPDGNRDIIIISRPIDRQLHHDLSDALLDGQKHNACTLFLTTGGGDADGAYRIGRCLQHHYDHIRLVVPSICKSAGTLIALSAHDLAIGDRGELGPLDVQVRKHNEMAERSSGLDFTQAMEASLNHVMAAFRNTLVSIRRGTRVSTKLAGEFAAQIAASIANPLYSQIDPNRVGEMQRAISIALEYGHRLNKKSNTLKNPDSLNRLVAGYPSHNFVIDRKECTEIFSSVAAPSDLEVKIYLAFWEHLHEESDYGPIVVPSPNANDNDSNGAPTADDARSHDDLNTPNGDDTTSANGDGSAEPHGS